MQNRCIGGDRSAVLLLEVIDGEAQLRARCSLALALVQREVEKRPVAPGHGPREDR
jgi:hypothetical protein